MGYRLRAGGGRSQLLARAVGLKGAASIDVLDATAGLGRDAFVLASLGCRVTLVERSPIVAALVGNGLARAVSDSAAGDTVSHMQLVVADARELLSRLASGEAGAQPDVVYMDPMYPQRTKAALVKKELRVLRALVGRDDDAAELLAVATRVARRRVVVKRPLRAPALEGPVASAQIRGKTTRYDIYSNVG
jgi:16S rRNA (guanine1516-N2)-methyltransferase